MIPIVSTLRFSFFVDMLAESLFKNIKRNNLLKWVTRTIKKHSWKYFLWKLNPHWYFRFIQLVLQAMWKARMDIHDEHMYMTYERGKTRSKLTFLKKYNMNQSLYITPRKNKINKLSLGLICEIYLFSDVVYIYI